jgi:hypothetical protein
MSLPSYGVQVAAGRHRPTLPLICPNGAVQYRVPRSLLCSDVNPDVDGQEVRWPAWDRRPRHGRYSVGL